MVEARCMRCKSAQEMKNPRQETTAKGSPIIKGVCAVCGTKMCKMGKL